MVAKVRCAGKNLVALRLERFLSRDELAAKAGVQRSTLQRLEQAKATGMSFAVLRKLAAALSLSNEELVDRIRPGAGATRTIRIPDVAYAGLADDAKTLGFPSVEAWLTALGTTLRDQVRRDPGEGPAAESSAPARPRSGSKSPAV